MLSRELQAQMGMHIHCATNTLDVDSINVQNYQLESTVQHKHPAISLLHFGPDGHPGVAHSSLMVSSATATPSTPAD